MKKIALFLFLFLGFSVGANELNRTDYKFKIVKMYGKSKDEFVKIKPVIKTSRVNSKGERNVEYVLIKRFELKNFESLVLGKLVWYDESRRDIQAIAFKKR